MAPSVDKQYQNAHEGAAKIDQPSSETFNFPFEPYNIQLELMKVAYEAYQNKKFALLESPTGTGKSLSLICSSLTWLFDTKNRLRKYLEESKLTIQLKIDQLKVEEESSGDWVSAQTKRQEATKELTELNKQLERILRIERRSEDRQHAKLHNIPLDSYSTFKDRRDSVESKLDETLNATASNQLIGSQESQLIDDEVDIERIIKEQEEDFVRPKIYYASRTHSQLGQFINEVKRTIFADPNHGLPVKVVTLASRANLCVNPDVLKLKDSGAINERCAEMQRETKADKKCPYIKLKQVNILKEDILSSVQDVEDIASRGRTTGACPYYAARMAVPEAELVVLPYNNLFHHDTRKASALDLKESVVIVDESHNILETICSIHSVPITGAQLIGSHTILSRYYSKYHTRMCPKNSSVIKVIIQFITALIKYMNDPKQHLSIYDCPASVDLDTPQKAQSSPFKDNKKFKLPVRHEEIMLDVNKFIGVSNIEKFNVYKIIDYFNRSQLARKLLGFFRIDDSLSLTLDISNINVKHDKPTTSSKSEDDHMTQPVKKRRTSAQKSKKQIQLPEQQVEHQSGLSEQLNLEFLLKSNSTITEELTNLTSYPIFTLVEFLKSLTNLSNDGKILTDFHEGNILKSSLKFILLNPSSQFEQVTQEASSIVLAGGTMQPFSEYTDLLFGPLNIKRDRLLMFSCSHVIKREQIFVATLATGPSSKALELSFKTRSSMETIDEYGRTLMNIAGVVPGGMVCFLPSYDYEQLCYNRWTHLGLIAKIETKSKFVFREPRVASQVKPTLDEYSRIIEKHRDRGRGALLFCVVGGKMSEGINFNDDLGRCIVMIGLPYANIKSGELQQKMAFYDRTCKTGDDKRRGDTSAGQQYYENLCIKGINQSIGRAIRHRNDYATIVLLDKRYQTKHSIRSGLPAWLSTSLIDYEKFGPMFSNLRGFFTNIDKTLKK